MARRLNVSGRRRVAVIGAGWAGLAAAVQAVCDGHDVTVHEMARHAGGRARGVEVSPGLTLDNGQHIMIGAYRETLRLMTLVGADPDRSLRRLPLELRYPDGSGLKVAGGPVLWGFGLGVLTTEGWSWPERLALLRIAFNWWRHGMRNPGVDTVSRLCDAVPKRVFEQLIEPLCVAALNTPAHQASATVFLRVLADALFGDRGGSDLLLPRVDLSQLFPLPATKWLQAHGGRLNLGCRVMSISRSDDAWLVGPDMFDAVVLACSAHEAARLATDANADWAADAASLRYEPIVTVYLRRSQRPLPVAMMALRADTSANPAQFVFDLGQLGMESPTLAFVVSGAGRWLESGLDAVAQAVRSQAETALPEHLAAEQPAWLHAAAERRATFACTPNLRRPDAVIASGLYAAGDYVKGPYPATLEGSVRSGVEAARLLG